MSFGVRVAPQARKHFAVLLATILACAVVSLTSPLVLASGSATDPSCSATVEDASNYPFVFWYLEVFGYYSLNSNGTIAYGTTAYRDSASYPYSWSGTYSDWAYQTPTSGVAEAQGIITEQYFPGGPITFQSHVLTSCRVPV